VATLEPNEDSPQIWQQPGCDPRAAAADYRRVLEAGGGSPWDVFLQQQKLREWAERRGTIIERDRITGRSETPGLEHELIFDWSGQRVLKITLPGFYAHTGGFQHGRLELIKARPLAYLERLALAAEMFGDGTEILGVVPHSAGPRILSAQPLIVGKRPDDAAIASWMASLGCVQVDDKVWWHEARGVAIFDVHGGNVLQTEDGRICAFDVAPCFADAGMTAFLNQRVRQWAAKL